MDVLLEPVFECTIDVGL